MKDNWIVLTDLDGTLLDHDSYDWRRAEPALLRLRRRRIPVVAVSSKTRFELDELRREIPYLSPVAGAENGALIIDGRSHPPRLEILGQPVERLIECFDRACREVPCAGIGFHQATDRQVADWTGLSVRQAALARRREASLPIHWPRESEGLDAFIETLERLGGRTLQGGRFLHLTGEADKGTASRRLRELFTEPGQSPPRVLALGDSGNDDAMLAEADIGIRIPAVGKRPRPEALASVITATRPGPEGWNETVGQWLDQCPPT